MEQFQMKISQMEQFQMKDGRKIDIQSSNETTLQVYWQG